MDPENARGLVTFAWGLFFLIWWLASKTASGSIQQEPALLTFLHFALFAGAFALALFPFLSIGALGRPLLGAREPLTTLGIVLALAGLGLAVWARAHLGRHWSGSVTIKEGHELIQTGPYAAVRHPIYSGLILAMLGTALVIGETRAWLALAFTIAACAIKIPEEERFMAQAFGETWTAYKARVKAIVPWLL